MKQNVATRQKIRDRTNDYLAGKAKNQGWKRRVVGEVMVKVGILIIMAFELQNRCMRDSFGTNTLTIVKHEM